MENADLLTNAAAALDRYRAEEHLLEAEVTIAQARLELVREFIAALSGRSKARRMRQAPKLVEAPDAPATTEPDLVA